MISRFRIPTLLHLRSRVDVFCLMISITKTNVEHLLGVKNWGIRLRTSPWDVWQSIRSWRIRKLCGMPPQYIKMA